MANIYIGSFRDLVRTYYDSAIKLQKEAEEAGKRYSEEYRKEALKPYEAKKEAQYNRVLSQIESIYNEVRGYLSVANFPDVNEITKDSELFTGNTGVNLTPNIVMGYAEKYKDNPTMSGIIANWLDSKHGFDDYTEVRRQMSLPKDKVEVYRMFAQGAIDTINKVHDNPKAVSKAFIEAYADESFAPEPFAKVGTGIELGSYKNKIVPSVAKTEFDAYGLNTSTSNVYNPNTARQAF